jgi:FlaA1/EpsC-like NDP-sugar epimerase
MPHVIVKTVPGKSEHERTRLAEEITKDVMDVAKSQCRSPSKKSNHRIGPRRSIRRKSLTVRRSSTRNRDTQCEKELDMNISFENKVALVTGAGSGMGLATAKAFAESGASVALADWNEKAVCSATEELAAQGHKEARLGGNRHYLPGANCCAEPDGERQRLPRLALGSRHRPPRRLRHRTNLETTRK